MGVEGITGLKINYYALVNMDGFRGMVQAMGGLTLNVRDRIPIGLPVTDYIEPGVQKLNGFETLWFARSRWSTDDYDRMQRQRCVIGAVVDQADPLKVAKNFPALAKALKKNLRTGIDSSDLEAWATLALRIQKGGVTSIVFDPDVISTVNPDFDKIHQLVAKAVKGTARVKQPKAAATTGAAASGTPETSAPKPTNTKRATSDTSSTGKAQDLKSVC
jgi:hypothetical protein